MWNSFIPVKGQRARQREKWEAREFLPFFEVARQEMTSLMRVSCHGIMWKTSDPLVSFSIVLTKAMCDYHGSNARPTCDTCTSRSHEYSVAAIHWKRKRTMRKKLFGHWPTHFEGCWVISMFTYIRRFQILSLSQDTSLFPAEFVLQRVLAGNKSVTTSWTNKLI